jgi:uncharacterized protein (DUF885 family)
MTQAPALQAWLDSFFAALYRRRPVDATFIGIHDYDHTLPDYSPTGVAATLGEIAALRRALAALPAEPLTPAERIDRRLAAGALAIWEWELGGRHLQTGNPSHYTGEAIFGLLSLLLRPYPGDRLAAARERLEATPAFLAQCRANVRAAPASWARRAISECEAAITLLGPGLEAFLAEQGLADAGLLRAGERAAAAFADLRAHLSGALPGWADEGYAAGEEGLALLLASAHCLPHSADEILAYAEQVLAEATAALERGAQALGAPSWQVALAGLADEHPSAEGYYARYDELWRACRHLAEGRDLLTWPDYPIRYVPRPAWVRAAAPQLYFLFYRAPAAFDNVSPVEYLLAPIEPDMPAGERERLLRATNDSVIKLNHVVHHGAIGHHVQNWYAYNRAESRVGRVAAVDCASRIALLCGGTMAEGWACYATELMAEHGFLTPREQLSELHTRVRMAARAICDVRLHTGRWTIDDAASFYQRAAAMPAAAARAEAEKNSMFPGTALMYLMGNDGILGLRRELAARPGFSLRGFHDRLLAFGSVPVSLIAAEMRAG